MYGVPYNATFTFGGTTRATVVSVQVDAPIAEIVDMTAVKDGAGYSYQVATGDKRGGSVVVDFIGLQSSEVGRPPVNADLTSLVGQNNTLVFASGAYSVTRRAIVESASVSARTGELVSGQIRFRITDYTPPSRN